MSAETVWRHWRRQVHDILEVGGDAHPAGRIVNAFIVTLIVLSPCAARSMCSIPVAVAAGARHPEILQRIRAVAAARSAGDGRQRKPRAAKRGKQDEPQAF